MEKIYCPYCGSELVRELTWDEKNELVREYGSSSDFICDNCEFLFDEEDVECEENRNALCL